MTELPAARAYAAFLAERRAGAGHRTLIPATPLAAGRLRRHGRVLVNFSGNDYLGLAREPALAQAAAEAARVWGTGSTASRLVCGHLPLFETLETRLAALKGTESALLWGGGFATNAGLLAALLDGRVLPTTPRVFADRLIHASLHQGLATAGVRPVRYRHNDLDHLETLLRREGRTDAPRFILTESVFSMDGDRADLAGLVFLRERYHAFLVVDEAHATGVLGPGGHGLAAAFPGRIDAVVGTCGKALGGYGAFVATSALVRDYLINRAASFIYATALPPPVLGALGAALDRLPALAPARERLQTRAGHLRRRLRAAGLDTGPSTTQIVPVILGAETRALAAQRRLEDHGLLAVAIRPPTVPPGTARLRLALSAGHTEADLDHLAVLLETLAHDR